MEFAEPSALLLALLAVPVAFLALGRRRDAFAVPSTAGVEGLPGSFRLRLARLRPLLRGLAVVLLAFAVAGPRIGDANAVVPGEGIDIALSLDISSSMTSSDLGSEVTRLEAVKSVVRDFIKSREDDRIGLVAFQREALALSPPTLDYDALDQMVEDLYSGLILPDGTGIGGGMATALNMLRESTAATRIVILLTDGEHNAPSVTPLEAADLADALHIPVYTIGVVSKDAGTRGIDDELMTEISERTGGQFYVVDDPAALLDVYEEIGDLEKSGVGRERFERFTQLAPWFLLPAAGLVALDLLLGATWLRRSPS